MLSQVVLFMKLLASSKKRVWFTKFKRLWCWIDLSNTRKSARRVKWLMNSRHCKSFNRCNCCLFALVSAGLAYTLNQNETNFVFIDHVHAGID
ncbi:hypothetical protein D5086_017475 [Populus alba]|uniref:Uncharacterized protein n=1 Tax=Populus alba TaxID=43335 RepID=A0ACC4BMQ3_POPAL